MERRRFGRTEHRSAVAIFGAAALWEVEQAEADAVMERVIAAGVNHLDVAPQYGLAEERLGPWLARERDRFFVGCKTMGRTKADAAWDLRRSLELLRTDHLDLYQLHAITSLGELDLVTGPGGALEALTEAREAGVTRWLGITGHGVDAPAVFRPFDRPETIQPAVDFTLSLEGVTGICTAGDTRVLPMVLDACERFTPMPAEERERLIEDGAARFTPLFG